MRNNDKSFLALFDTVADILFNALALFAAFVLTPFISDDYFLTPTTGLLIVSFVALLVLSFAYQVIDYYRPGCYVKRADAFLVLLRADLFCFFAFAIVIILSSGIDETRAFLLRWTVLSFAFSVVLLSFKRSMTIRLVRYFRKRNVKLRKIIIVGDNTESAKEYIKQLKENPQYGFMILGFVGDRIRYDVGVDKLGSFENLGEILDRYQPSDVIFAIDSYNKKRLIRLVNQCDDRLIKVYFLPVNYGYFKSPQQIEQLGALPLINIHATPLDNRVNASLKRLTDVIGSFLLLLLSSPLLLFSAIAVKISFRGNVILKQERVGKMGKTFTMFKFRSSPEKSEGNGGKFGEFLRISAIDELPQLVNVLRGDMSLVGPRPEIPFFVDTFKTQIPLYMVKHYVKPGMTGLAQIRGLRGYASVSERIKADIFYIENWSYFMDLFILLQTPFKAANRAEKDLPVDEQSAVGITLPDLGEEADSPENPTGEAAVADTRNTGKEKMQ